MTITAKRIVFIKICFAISGDFSKGSICKSISTRGRNANSGPNLKLNYIIVVLLQRGTFLLKKKGKLVHFQGAAVVGF